MTEDLCDVKGRAIHQMPAQAGRSSDAVGEVVCYLPSDEACGPPQEHPATRANKAQTGTGDLREAALARQNLQLAWKRVKANKGAAGGGGLDIEQTAAVLKLR